MPRATCEFSAVPAVIPRPSHQAMVLAKSSMGQVSLMEQMGVDMDEFNVFTKIVRDSARLHLTDNTSMTKQDQQSLVNHFNEIKRNWSKANRYEDVWPAHTYTAKYLNERSTHYRRGSIVNLWGTSRNEARHAAAATHSTGPVRQQKSKDSRSAGPRTFIGKPPPKPQLRSMSSTSRLPASNAASTAIGGPPQGEHGPQPHPMSSISRPPASTAQSSTSEVSSQEGPSRSANNNVEDETQEVYIFLQSLDLPLGHLLPSFVSSGVKNMMRLRLLTKHHAWEDYIERHITKDRFEILMLEKGFKELAAEN